MPHLVFIVPILMGLGCSDDKPIVEDEQDNFASDTSIIIQSPSNGSTVEDTFQIQYEAGSDIHHLELRVDNIYYSNPSITESESTVHIEDAGAHKLSLLALDENNIELSTHDITVSVNIPDSNWVTIVSPTDDSIVSNPVRFTVDASANIDVIEIFADEWSLGTIAPNEILTYSFQGTGFERDIVAKGYENGVEVSEHNIQITVDAGTAPLVSDFNELVMDIIPTYPVDGSHGYYWPSSGNWLGTTEDIWYQGELIAEGDPNNQSYCVGLTFEVFMKAWQDADALVGGDGSINGMTIQDLQEFRIDWYVRELFGAGPADAVENYGIGELVTDWDDVQPGDFLQFWRNSGSGHNVIFIDWEWDGDGNVNGFYYWSTQSSTDGIGYRSEYFGSTGSTVNPQYFFPARVYMPDEWVTWYQ